jgi:hypothetical protein
VAELPRGTGVAYVMTTRPATAQAAPAAAAAPDAYALATQALAVRQAAAQAASRDRSREAAVARLRALEAEERRLDWELRLADDARKVAAVVVAGGALPRAAASASPDRTSSNKRPAPSAAVRAADVTLRRSSAGLSMYTPRPAADGSLGATTPSARTMTWRRQ